MPTTSGLHVLNHCHEDNRLLRVGVVLAINLAGVVNATKKHDINAKINETRSEEYMRSESGSSSASGTILLFLTAALPLLFETSQSLGRGSRI